MCLLIINFKLVLIINLKNKRKVLSSLQIKARFFSYAKEPIKNGALCSKGDKDMTNFLNRDVGKFDRWTLMKGRSTQQQLFIKNLLHTGEFSILPTYVDYKPDATASLNKHLSLRI